MNLGIGAVVGWAACGPAGPSATQEPPEPTAQALSCGDGVQVEVIEPPGTALVRGLQLTAPRPVAADLEVDGVVVARWPAAARHDLPVFGRPGAVLDVRVLLTCDGGLPGAVGPLAVDVGDGPDPWPTVEILVDDPSRRSPGLTVLDLGQPEGVQWVVALEPDGVPVWAWASATGKVLDARVEPDGTVWVLTDDEIAQLDLLGQPLRRWRPAAPVAEDVSPDPGAVPVEVNLFHHEVYPVPGGFLAMDQQSTAVDAYPTSTLSPDGPFAAASLLDPVVVEVDLDGTVRSRFDLVSRLDPQRIGWLSLQESTPGFDWGHANAVAVHPVDGDLVVSVRHQSALVKLDRATGEVVWIFGNPAGWRSPWAERLLVPLGDVTWPGHQHAPMLTVAEDGTLEILLFDNGNFARTTPYDGDPDDTDDGQDYVSRLAAFRVDEAAGTVTEVWAFQQTSTGRLYSGAFGDADLLPGGNRLGVWGMMFVDGGVRNVERDRGQKSVRLVEAAPDRSVVWELSAWGALDEAPEGWQTHRAQRLPSLYPLTAPGR